MLSKKQSKLFNNLGSFLRKRVRKHVLTWPELTKLCKTPSHLSLPKRSDKVKEVVLLMAYLGLRITEAINFTWQTKWVENQLALVVQGKGKKEAE